jgi:uncharacterized protein
VEFAWDPEKAESNFEKHRVHFADAQTIFKDDGLQMAFDETSEEEGYTAIGVGSLGEISFVVYTVRGETLRFISARRATRRERREYEYR